ncbi:MAG: purine nucleoside permease [Desulfotalea sp.]
MKITIKVFIAAMYELGGVNDESQMGEFQLWYNGYFKDAELYHVKGAESPVWVNDDGVAGSVLGIGKVASSSSMTAIICDDRFSFDKSYFILSGCAGVSPDSATIGSVCLADHFVDYDLGKRWGEADGKSGESLFTLLGVEDVASVIHLNTALVNDFYDLAKNVSFVDSERAILYRDQFSQVEARKEPSLCIGSHVSGDTYFHGKVLSLEAQYICELNSASRYITSDMEGIAVGYVLKKFGYIDRTIGIRAAVNFDQPPVSAELRDHLDHTIDDFPGCFHSSLNNLFAVGRLFVNELVDNWDDWQAR